MHHLLRWVGSVLAAIGVSVACIWVVDIMTSRTKARTLWHHVKWAAIDAWRWLAQLPVKLPAILTYELGFAQARWVELRRQYREGKFSDG